MPSWKKLVTSGSDASIPSVSPSGDFTIDAGGDIVLDADGADILLKDGGTHFGSLKRVTSDLVIKSETQDKDILFKGNDNGSVITALQLDMSDNGKAIFSGVISGDGSELTNLPAQTGTITALNNQAANRLVTIGSTTTELDGEANLEYDGSKLDVSAGDISIDEDYKLYLDGGSNTYITSNAGDTIRLFTGGSDRVTVDSGGRVGISNNAPSELLHIVSSANNATPVILLENTNAGTYAPQINLYNNSSSPADDDFVGQIDFEGKDSAGNRTQYSRIISQIEDATANTEDGLLDLNVMVGGTLTNALRIKGGATGTELTSPGSISGSAFVGKQTAASMTGANNIDLSTSANHNVTITGNITLTPTNFSGRLGQSGIITLIQDSSGGHSITLNSLFKTPRGDSISFDTTADGISLMSYYVINASNVAVNYLGPFS